MSRARWVAREIGPALAGIAGLVVSGRRGGARRLLVAALAARGLARVPGRAASRHDPGGGGEDPDPARVLVRRRHRDRHRDRVRPGAERVRAPEHPAARGRAADRAADRVAAPGRRVVRPVRSARSCSSPSSAPSRGRRSATISAFRQVPPLLAARGHDAGRAGWALYRSVIFPAALPGYVGGLQQAWGFAWKALMAGELIVAGVGRPASGSCSRSTSKDVPALLAPLAVIVAIGVGGRLPGVRPARPARPHGAAACSRWTP